MARGWMPLYVADYLADTGHLSTVEHGAYLLLIMHYWQNAGLPDDDKKLSRIVRMTADEWADVRETLADLFSEGWQHSRINAELEKADNLIERRRAAGKAGASVRYSKRTANAQQTHADATANAQQTDSQSQSQSHTSGSNEPSGGRERATTPEKVSARSSPKRKQRLPQDWTLSDEERAFAIQSGLDPPTVEDQAVRFRDYWLGNGEPKADWTATWRNWVRKSKEFGNGRNRGTTGKRNSADPHASFLASFADGFGGVDGFQAEGAQPEPGSDGCGTAGTGGDIVDLQRDGSAGAWR